jgi:hypothetical protein
VNLNICNTINKSIKNLPMTGKLRLGVGATVSFPLKWMHPHRLRDEGFPGQPGDKRVTEALVVRREVKLINHKETMCVILHHSDFKDKRGRYHRLWCAESHIQVEKEGDPGQFFEMANTADKTDKDSSDDEMEKNIKDLAVSKDGDPLSTVQEVYSFVPNSKTWCLIVSGFFFACCSGAIFPAMAWIFSGSFSDLSASAQSEDYMQGIRTLAFNFMVLGVVAFSFMTLQALLLELAATEMTMTFKHRWFQALLRQDMAYYDLRDVSGTSTILTRNAQKFKQ